MVGEASWCQRRRKRNENGVGLAGRGVPSLQLAASRQFPDNFIAISNPTKQNKLSIDMAFLAATLLGAPGAGKGTYAKKLIELLRVPHVSSGDIFRAQIEVLKCTLRKKGNFGPLPSDGACTHDDWRFLCASGPLFADQADPSSPLSSVLKSGALVQDEVR